MREKLLTEVLERVTKKSQLLLSTYYIPLKAKRSPLDEFGYDLATQVEGFIKAGEMSVPSVFLLQGDSGSGKTTFTLQLLTRLVGEARTNLEAPLPILVDHWHPEYRIQDWLKVSLIKDYHLSEEEIVALRERSQIVVIVDSFDELVRFDEKGWLTLTNLSMEGRLDDWGDGRSRVKLLVTCRTHFLRDKASYRKFFGSRLDDAETYYLAPFDDSQIDAYLEDYIKGFPEGLQKRYRGWFRKFPGLVELASNPLLLAMVLRILLELKTQRDSLTRIVDRLRPIKRVEIFKLYADKWFERELNRFSHILEFPSGGDVRASTPTLYAVKVGTEAEFTDLSPVRSVVQNRTQQLESFRAYVRYLAWSMVRAEKLEVELREPSYLMNEKLWSEFSLWEKLLADRREVHASRMASLIHRTDDGSFSFMHLDFRDFFSAEFLFATLNSEEKVFRLKRTRFEQPFNEMYLAVSHRVILQFIAQIMKADDKSETELLLKYVNFSRSNAAYSCAASNAISILNYLGFSFSLFDLSGVHIPYADLSGAILYKANFSGADLANVTLVGANLFSANLSAANLVGVRTDNQVYYHMGTTALRSLTIREYAENHFLVVAGAYDENPLLVINLSSKTRSLRLGPHSGFYNIGSVILLGLDYFFIATKPSSSELLEHFGEKSEARESFHDPDYPLLIFSSVDKLVFKLVGHQGRVTSMFLFPAMGLLTVGSDGALFLWQLHTPFEPTKLLQHASAFEELRCSDVVKRCLILDDKTALYSYEFQGVNCLNILFFIADNVISFDIDDQGNALFLRRERRIFSVDLSSESESVISVLSEAELSSNLVRWVEPAKSFVVSAEHQWAVYELKRQRLVAVGLWQYEVESMEYDQATKRLYAIGDHPNVLSVDLNPSPLREERNFEVDGVVDLTIDNTNGLIFTRNVAGTISLLSKTTGRSLLRFKGAVPQAGDTFIFESVSNKLIIKGSEVHQYGYTELEMSLEDIRVRHGCGCNLGTICIYDASREYRIFYDVNNKNFSLTNIDGELMLSSGNFERLWLDFVYGFFIIQPFLVVSGAVLLELVYVFIVERVLEDRVKFFLLSSFFFIDAIILSYRLYLLGDSYRMAEYRENTGSYQSALLSTIGSYDLASGNYLDRRFVLKEAMQVGMAVQPSYLGGPAFIALFFPLNILYRSCEVVSLRLKVYQTSVLPFFTVSAKHKHVVLAKVGRQAHIVSFIMSPLREFFSLTLCELEGQFGCHDFGELAHNAPLSHLLLSYSQEYLCSADFDGEVVLWRWFEDTKKYVPQGSKISIQELYPLRVISFSEKDDWLAIGAKGKVFLVNVESAQLTAVLESIHGDVSQILFDDSNIIVATVEGEVSYWRNNNGVRSLAWRLGNFLNIENLDLNFSRGGAEIESPAVIKQNFAQPWWRELFSKNYLTAIGFYLGSCVNPSFLGLAMYHFPFSAYRFDQSLLFISTPWLLCGVFQKNIICFRSGLSLLGAGLLIKQAGLMPFRRPAGSNDPDYFLISSITAMPIMGLFPPIMFFNKDLTVYMKLATLALGSFAFLSAYEITKGLVVVGISWIATSFSLGFSRRFEFTSGDYINTASRMMRAGFLIAFLGVLFQLRGVEALNPMGVHEDRLNSNLAVRSASIKPLAAPIGVPLAKEFVVSVYGSEHPCFYSSGRTNVREAKGFQPTQAILAPCKQPEPWNPYTLLLLNQSVRQGGFSFADGFGKGFSDELASVPVMGRHLLYGSIHLGIQYLKGYSLFSGLLWLSAQQLLTKVGVGRASGYLVILALQLLSSWDNEVNANEQLMGVLSLLFVSLFSELCGRSLGQIAGRNVDRVLRTTDHSCFFRAAPHQDVAAEAAAKIPVIRR